jgi:hypothetical protein
MGRLTLQIARLLGSVLASLSPVLILAGSYQLEQSGHDASGNPLYQVGECLTSGGSVGYGIQQNDNGVTISGSSTKSLNTGGGFDPTHAACEGGIVTHWKWTAAPGEPESEPSQVIVKERVLVEYEVTESLEIQQRIDQLPIDMPVAGDSYCDTDLPNGACVDNGVFFHEPGPRGQFFLLGRGNRGQKEFFRYSVATGTGTEKRFRVELSPGAKAESYDAALSVFSSSLMIMEASVTYEITLFNPMVKMNGVTEFPDDPDGYDRFLTGQQIEAEIVGLPPELDIKADSHEWELDEGIGAFKDYITVVGEGRKDDLLADDLKQPKLLFFSSKEGLAKCEVTVDFELPADSVFDGSFTDFQIVSKPTHSDKPTLEEQETEGHGSTVWREEGLVFFASPGQIWRNLIIEEGDPWTDEGEGCIIQLIKPYRLIQQRARYWDSENQIWIEQPQSFFKIDDYLLDTVVPYSPTDPDTGIGIPSTWQIKQKGHSVDYPAQPTMVTANSNYQYKPSQTTVNDSFETWVMYKPKAKDGFKTVWIPIRKLSWSWSASATYNGNSWFGNWHFVASDWSLTFTPTPHVQFSKTNDFPKWVGNLPSPFNFNSGY